MLHGPVWASCNGLILKRSKNQRLHQVVVGGPVVMLQGRLDVMAQAFAISLCRYPCNPTNVVGSSQPPIGEWPLDNGDAGLAATLFVQAGRDGSNVNPIVVVISLLASYAVVCVAFVRITRDGFSRRSSVAING